MRNLPSLQVAEVGMCGGLGAVWEPYPQLPAAGDAGQREAGPFSEDRWVVSEACFLLGAAG